MTVRPRILVVLSLAMVGSPTLADDPAISIADLPAYQAAISGKSSLNAIPITFRELWEHPQAHQGQTVEVEGRLARLFRQPGVGKFPPLAEAWITSPAGEPTCLVFPTGSRQVVPDLGSQVRFVGTFLRRITYPGGDTSRIAPLVVGPDPPIVPNASVPLIGGGVGPIFGGNSLGDWAIGVAASLGVLAVLLRRHLAHPPSGPSPVGPMPTFLDGDEASSHITSESSHPGGEDDW